MVVELKAKSQVTIPASIIKQAQLKQGDSFDVTYSNGNIILKPVVFVSREDAAKLRFANEMDKRYDSVKAGNGQVHSLIEA